MAKHVLTLDSLATIDEGRISAAFGAAMQRASKDCVDRPGDARARTVSLKLTLKPQADEIGVCETASVECEIHESVPSRRSKTYAMEADARGQLVFHDDRLDDVEQMGIGELIESDQGGAS